MNHREIILYWSTVGFEILLCSLVYLRHLQRRLPFFTAYATVLLMGTFGLQLAYHHFGFRSTASYDAAWVSAGLIVMARSVAIAELCRYELRGYQGIWAFTWRILALLAVFCLGHAAVDAWGQIDRVAIYGLTIERDIEISSIVVLLAMLLIRHYYGLTLEPLHWWIAVGMCVITTIDVINNTFLRALFIGPLSSWFHTSTASSWSELRPQIKRADDLWNMVRTSGSIVSMTAWCFALVKPLPAPAPVPQLLPIEAYDRLSPAINLRLRAFNDRLLEMLKP